MSREPIVTPGAWGPEELVSMAEFHVPLTDDCAGCRRVRAARKWGAAV